MADEYISKEPMIEEMRKLIDSVAVNFPNATETELIILKGKYEAFIEYIQEQPAADVQPIKWISVKDRLPNEPCECLGVVNGEVTEVSYNPKQKGLICVWSMCDADGFKPLPDDAVTHWMLLPEPPKDGEQNDD